MKKPYSEHELLDKYKNPEWRKNLLEIIDLTDFLDGCVIRSDYKISDELNNAIVPSAAGSRMVLELGKAQGGEKVPTKEARLMCLLHLAHVEILIDPEKMSVDALAKAISNQLVDREILLPHVHGPDLYEKAADLFPERRRFLGISDTAKLLDGQPIGVFQSGYWVSGPFGLHRSEARRNFSPTMRVPLQHCHDVSCTSVHDTRLDTDGTAPINSLRHRVHRYHELESDTPSEWSKFIATISNYDDKIFDDFELSTTFALLGDGFDVVEIRNILSWLLDHTGGTLREYIAKFGYRGRAIEITSVLSAAECLQLCLLCDDKVIARAIDTLIFRRTIEIPAGEVRTPVLRRDIRQGIFRIRLEASALGVRLRARDDVAAMRLRRLVEHLYPGSDSDAEDELKWQLRSIPGVSLEARLDEFLRTASPHEVLSRLVLSRRSHVSKAGEELHLEITGAEDDDTLVDRILWKLGFDVDITDSLRIEYWTGHERLRQAAQTANVSTLVDYELVRSVAVSYFVKLEEFLTDTLSFATWVLLNDHVVSQHPFQYDFERDRVAAFARLEEFDIGRTKKSEDRIRFGEDLTLYPLVRGFECLAGLLSSSLGESSKLLRNSSQYPNFHKNTELQRFPFTHTIPFLDLVPSAQDRLVNGLNEISALLVQSEIASARNDQLHFRRSAADLDALMKTLDLVASAIQKVELLGIVRDLFYPDKVENDRWGRRTVFLSNRRGKEIALARPTSHGLLRLPNLSTPQYIVSSAQFAEPNDMLRAIPTSKSSFSTLWARFPQRRQKGERIGSADSELEAQAVRNESS
ncbi:hypothetical protein LN996_16435 [Arthrobacter sp. AK01]|uniref:hypothetical protein n=1 Tax=Arthrobacter sp. AK01 TaxID=2894084 RepID=UPI001E3CA217|nr:hypothetical protein [Arthrobacter sp. AK01]MCD4852404.1 hypothetical protein [Arthrobacter sp. AK01]